MAAVVADAGADLCLMHMLGEPRTMQDDPSYDDVVAEVESFLAERAEVAVAAGVARERIALDPGIGFGKTLAHNLALLRALPRLARLGPLLVGVSRKRFLGTLTGRRSRPTAWRRRSRLRSTATAAAPTSCACTTCGPRRMRSPSSGRWRAWRERAAHDRGARAARARPSRRARARARARTALRARPRARAAARRSGCETDRLGDTVSYGDAARLAVEVATSTRFDLIERLAAHVADTLLARLPLERATVTVHKPEAPLGLEFDDVAVTVSRVRVPSLRS